MPFGDRISLDTNDGFGNDEDDPVADYVVWQGETGAHSARVHFLHGALHLFDAGTELKKFTWVRSGARLIEQARDAINSNAYPLFVAEGTSANKKEKIRHNAYLYQGLEPALRGHVALSLLNKGDIAFSYLDTPLHLMTNTYSIGSVADVSPNFMLAYMGTPIQQKISRLWAGQMP
jgi:hypothetical protein